MTDARKDEAPYVRPAFPPRPMPVLVEIDFAGVELDGRDPRYFLTRYDDIDRMYLDYDTCGGE